MTETTRHEDAEVERLNAVVEEYLGCYDTVMNVRVESREIVRLILAALPPPASDAAVARVLALHQPYTRHFEDPSANTFETTTMEQCHHDGKPWPCPTALAAEGRT